MPLGDEPLLVLTVRSISRKRSSTYRFVEISHGWFCLEWTASQLGGFEKQTQDQGVTRRLLARRSSVV